MWPKDAPESDPIFVPHAFYEWEAPLHIGISSIVGTVWFIMTMFVYVKTTETDGDLNIQGRATVPVEWFWYNFNNQATGWMAWSYFTHFAFYLTVSFLEFVAWCAYMGGFAQFLRYWIEWTYYVFIWYIPAWVFALVHLTAPKANGGLAFPTRWVEF